MTHSSWKVLYSSWPLVILTLLSWVRNGTRHSLCHEPPSGSSAFPKAASSSVPPCSILLLQCPCARGLSPIFVAATHAQPLAHTHPGGHFTPGFCEVNVKTNPTYSCLHSDGGILKMKINSGSFKSQCRCHRRGCSTWESWILSSCEKENRVASHFDM